jgi:XTP/dITP diphosphohydrolase
LRRDVLRKPEALYLLTNNEGKLKEFNELGANHNLRIAKAGFEKLEIQSSSLEEIATYAALTGYLNLRKPLFAEDAGLFIQPLKGFPGPYSSYVFKTIGNEGILKLMQGITSRKACFKSAICLVLNSQTIKVFTGEVCGSISKEVRGEKGFGFDPIFIPEGYTKTFAEMSVEEKNKISHRAKAFNSMMEWLESNSF